MNCTMAGKAAPSRSKNQIFPGESGETRMNSPEADGAVPVSVTVMKEMPHGAIHDQSRAAWRFLSRFRRIEGTGFGALLAKGTREAVLEKGLLGVLSGGFTASAAGIAAARISAWIWASKRGEKV